jgi:hypothetical protein
MPQIGSARLQPVQQMSGAVAFLHPLGGKSGPLKVNIDGAGEYMLAMSHPVTNIAHDIETGIEERGRAHRQTMTVRGACNYPCVTKVFRAGNVQEVRLSICQSGVCLPDFLAIRAAMQRCHTPTLLCRSRNLEMSHPDTIV